MVLSVKNKKITWRFAAAFVPTALPNGRMFGEHFSTIQFLFLRLYLRHV